MNLAAIALALLAQVQAAAADQTPAPAPVPVPVQKVPKLEPSIATDLARPLSGRATIVVTVPPDRFDRTSFTEATLDVDIDGQPVGKRAFASSASYLKALPYPIDTATLPDGPHAFRVTVYLKPSSTTLSYPGNALFKSVVAPFTTQNGSAFRDLRTNAATAHLAVGESLTIKPRIRSSDGEEILAPATFDSDDTTVATVDAYGNVKAVKEGKANVYSTLGLAVATSRIVVGPHKGIPHFARDGTALQAYDPTRSIFMTAVFGLDGAAMDRDPIFAAAVKKSGVNTLSTGFFRNPADGDGTAANILANNTREVDRIIAFATKHDMLVLLIGDDMARTAKELWRSITDPTCAVALKSAMIRLRASDRVIGIEAVDEINAIWGDTPTPTDGRWLRKVPPIPDDGFARLMGILGPRSERPSITWPNAASTNDAAIRNWLGNPAWPSEHVTMYWDPTSYSVSVNGRALPEYWKTLRAKNDAFSRLAPRDVPKLVLGWIDGPSYVKMSPGGDYNPAGGDVMVLSGHGPEAVALNVFGAAILGAAGVREYGLDTDAKKRLRLAKPVGEVKSWVSTGADPLTVGTDRWNAMGEAFGVVHKITPQLFGAPMTCPDLGDFIAVAARDSAQGRLLMVANYWEADRPVRIDLTPYRLGGVVTRYSVRGDRPASATVVDSLEDRVVLKAGECLAYAFLPANREEANP